MSGALGGAPGARGRLLLPAPVVAAPRGTDALADHGFGQGGVMRRCPVRVPAPRSGFAGFRFPREVIVLAGALVPACATRRLVISPAQLGGTRREVLGSDGFT